MTARVVVWFSCGAASAVASKLAIDKYGHDRVSLVYCDVLASEHPDNRRFMQDVERWLKHSVEVIHSEKYDSIDDVFAKRRYMSGIKGAPCTAEMKKVPRHAYQRVDDIHVFGLAADEAGRIKRFKEQNFELQLDFVLLGAGVSHADCLNILEGAGIPLPPMYALGFKNNNCIGCVKATSPAYWQNVRKHFPEIYEKRAQQSRDIGCKLARYKGKRIFLDELPELDFGVVTESITCGPDCGDGK